MLAGIVLQFVTTLAFLAVFGVYFRRLAREYPERHVTRLQSGTGVVFRGTLAMGALMIIRYALSPFPLERRRPCRLTEARSLRADTGDASAPLNLPKVSGARSLRRVRNIHAQTRVLSPGRERLC